MTTTNDKPARKDVERTIIHIVAQEFALADEAIKLETKLDDDLTADWIDRMEIRFEIEDEFEFAIPAEDMEKIKTVGQAVDYVMGRM